MNFLLFVGDKNSLTQAEISAQIPQAKALGDHIYQIVFTHESEIIDKVSRLGCAIKLAKLVASHSDFSPETLFPLISTPNYSICSLEESSEDKRLSHQIKVLGGSKLRFIEPKNKFGLTPVIFASHPTSELFLSHKTGEVYQTIWHHDFYHWIKKDRELPFADKKNGLLPPKIARSLINLIKYPPTAKIHDPFCGSGRILVEAAELGLTASGSDIMPRQVEESSANLQALGLNAQLFVCDATHLSTKLSGKVDLIVTEPFLGKVDIREDRVKYIVVGLKKLYLGCLKDWLKILNPGASVVMIFPVLTDSKQEYATSQAIDDPHLVGYNVSTRGLYYFRPEAKVKREIVILEKK